MSGDLGWFWRLGAAATAAAVRTWSRDGQVLAVGLLDGPTLLRLTIARDAQRDEELAQQLVDDLTEPERGVLREGKIYVEAPIGALIHDPHPAARRRPPPPRTALAARPARWGGGGCPAVVGLALAAGDARRAGDHDRSS